jgi:hypothetical protein
MKRSLGILAFCWLAAWPARAAEVSPEYQVKAAFLLNFTRFIEWPQSAFSSPNAPFRICIAGRDPFGGALTAIIGGERVNSHPLMVEKLEGGQVSFSHCPMIFFPRSENNEAALIPRLGRGVLTVGETEDFLRIGGIIRFVLENNRVRFDVNQTAARRAGLLISSRLLKIARYVESGGGQ